MASYDYVRGNHQISIRIENVTHVELNFDTGANVMVHLVSGEKIELAADNARLAQEIYDGLKDRLKHQQ